MSYPKEIVSSLRRLTGYLLLFVAAAAAFLESRSLLANVPENLRSPVMIALICGVCGLVWATTLVVVRKIGHAIFETRVNAGPLSIVLGLITYSVLTVPFVLFYLGSWNYYEAFGRFTGWEVVDVAVRNQYALWQQQPDWLENHRQLFLSCGVIVGGILPLIYLLSYFAASAETESLRDWVTRFWLACAIAIVGGLLCLFQFSKPHEQGRQIGYLNKAANPWLTLGASVWESVTEDPIRPVLAASKLTPRPAAWTAKPTTARPSVIFVGIESLRHDLVGLSHQGREVTPYFNRLAKRGVQFDNSFANSTHADYADACIVSSLYPLRTRLHHYYNDSDRWPVTRIYDLLKPAGYATAVVSSRDESESGLDSFYKSKGLDRLEVSRTASVGPSGDGPGGDATLEGDANQDEKATNKAVAWIKEHQSSPFFLNLSLNGARFPYTVPNTAEAPFTPDKLSDAVRFGSFPESMTVNIRNAYFNAIHESDRQLGRIIAALDQAGILDSSILVVTGKTGEAFEKSGVVGHSLAPLDSAVHVGTVLHAPKLLPPRTETYPLEHVDLVPTTLSLLGWLSHPNFQGQDVLATDRVQAKKRLVFFHAQAGGVKSDAVVLGGRWKYLHDRNSNFGRLYDLARDPREMHDMIQKYPKLARKLHELLKQWRGQQLAYYHFPEYYTKAFPPKAPLLKGVQEGIAVDTPADKMPRQSL